MRLALRLALLLLPCALGCGDAPRSVRDPLLVATESGRVRGVLEGGVRVFRGIPYAAAPEGELRWRPPVPATPWDDVRDASTLGPACPGTLPVLNVDVGDDEDCLSVNVVTPSPAPRAAAVMVWMHGGGFTSRDPLFGSVTLGDRLAAASGVVVVSFNYRLGQLGFLAHPALSGEDPERGTSGNYGIADQVAALEWVRRNIAAFGGDPDEVTLFGQSAGGWSVCLHLASGRSRGLFRRAIVESGVCTVPLPTLAEAEAQGERLSVELGCAVAPDVLACLRAASTSDLRRALPPDPSVFLLEGDFGTWRPNVDGEILDHQIATSFGAAQGSAVPVLIGSNRDEGTFFVLAAHEYNDAPLSADLYADRLRVAFGPSLADEIARRYPLERFASPAAALAEAVGDGILSCPTLAGARLLARRMPVYAYQFDFREAQYSLGEPVLLDPGAFHSAEIPFVFGFASLPAEVSLADAMQGYWTRFAKTGDPNGAGAPRWPRLDAGEGYLSFDEEVAARVGPRAEACAFWREIDLELAPHF